MFGSKKRLCETLERAVQALERFSSRLDALRAEIKALREAHDELADEMMREHGIVAATGVNLARWEPLPLSPRRFAYDETRTIRRTKKAK